MAKTKSHHYPHTLFIEARINDIHNVVGFDVYMEPTKSSSHNRTIELGVYKYEGMVKVVNETKVVPPQNLR